MHFYNKYLDGQWTDARIILDDGHKYYVHKIILSTVPYFDSLFSADGMNESHTGDVSLQNISSDIMDVLIEYIYKREFRVNAENAADLFIAADMLQISPLVGKCLEVMLDNLNLDNCVDLLNMADFFDTASCLRNPVLDFVSRNIRHITEKNFECLRRDSLISILSREQLAVEDEMILFQLLMAWVSADEEERSRDLHLLLRLIRYGTVSSSNANHILGHPIIAKDRKCRRMIRKFVQKPEDHFLECEIPRTPISFVCLTDKTDVALGYRKKVNGWSYCNFTLREINAFVTSEDTTIKITDGKYLYTIVSAKDYTADVSPTLIQTDFSSRTSTKLSNLPFIVSKDQAACCYGGKLYVFNGIRKGENPHADAYKYDVETMTWTEITIPDDVLEPFHAFGHRGKIYLAQQYAQSLHVLDADTDDWSKTPAMSRSHVRAMYAAMGDHIYVIGGAKSCREVEKLDVSVSSEKWTQCASLPKHVHGLTADGSAKKLILNFIGAALTYEKMIYVFLDSREMYFDYTSAYLGEEENGPPEQGTVFIFDQTKGPGSGKSPGSAKSPGSGKSPAARADGKWVPCRFAPVAFIKPFVFINNLDSFITGSDDYQ